MKPSISVNTKKRGRPKTTGKGQMLGVRVQPPQLSALDAWITAQPDPKPTRPEAIRRLLEKALAGEPDQTAETIEGGSLNASND